MNCKTCNKIIDGVRQKCFCSKSCQYIGFKGNKNPRYKSAKLNSFCLNCNKEFSYYKGSSTGIYCSTKCSFSCEKWKTKQSISKKGKTASPESRLKMSNSRLGKKHSTEWCINKGKSLSKYYDKIGRITPEIQKIRLSKENQKWREFVFERDKYKCVFCGSNKNINADHIIPLGIIYREYILNKDVDFFDVDNGRTLCFNCHKKTDSFSKHSSKTIQGKLIYVLEKINKQGANIDFEVFYKNELEKIITHYKSKLNDSH